MFYFPFDDFSHFLLFFNLDTLSFLAHVLFNIFTIYMPEISFPQVIRDHTYSSFKLLIRQKANSLLLKESLQNSQATAYPLENQTSLRK